MVKLGDAVIARYEHEGERFELLVDPYLAMDLKHGKEQFHFGKRLKFILQVGWEMTNLKI